MGASLACLCLSWVLGGLSWGEMLYLAPGAGGVAGRRGSGRHAQNKRSRPCWACWAGREGKATVAAARWRPPSSRSREHLRSMKRPSRPPCTAPLLAAARDDVAVITANPKTAGVARWIFLALWGARLSKGKKAATQYVTKVGRWWC